MVKAVYHSKRLKEDKRMIELRAQLEKMEKEMEDEGDDGTPPPRMERKIENTDSIEELVRRVRGY